MGNTSISGGSGDGAFEADANTQITPATPILLDQATGDEAALTLDYTTNKATSGNDTGLLINNTDQFPLNSPGTSNLLDLQVGGTSKLSVNSSGDVVGISGYKIQLRGGGLSHLYKLNLIDRLGFSYSFGPYLQSDATNTLAQRDGVNAQTYNIYNSYTSATDYERGHIGWNDTNDTFVIGTEAAGTGVLRNIKLTGGNIDVTPGAGAALRLGANTSITWQLTTGHVFGPTGNNVRDLASSSLRVRSLYLGTSLDIAQGTLTDDAQALNIASTWNDAADTFTLIKADVTDTASAAGSKLLDLQVGGASKFSVDNAGAVSIGAGIQHTAAGGGSVARTIVAGVQRLDVGATAIGISSGASIAWNSSNYASLSGDLLLSRDAAGTLAQRNGVNAQTYNIYNTYTDATNYERGHIGWNDTADTFVIGTEAGSGGGVEREVHIYKGNTRCARFTGSWTFIDTAGFLVFGSARVQGGLGIHGVTPPAQASHIADPSGGATVDAESRTAINAILVALENIGITAAS